jgi:hypothetical protein
VLDDIRYLAARPRRKDRAPCVVVFIDDLDRCSDEKVLETLQAINLLLTASSCYALLDGDPTASGEDTGPLQLTVGQLLPGTQFSEAGEISSLFRMSA